MKKLTINQSNYIPWRGRFDMIAAADEYIIFDSVSVSVSVKSNFYTRNLIKTPAGSQLLIIPINHTLGEKIKDVQIAKESVGKWNQKHWKSIELNYRRAKYFDEISVFLRPLYLENMPTDLHSVNKRFIVAICNYLGIKTVIKNSWEYNLIDGKTEKLIDLCLQSGADEYITPPGAKDYINEELFRQAGIKLTYFDYDGLEPYSQLWGDFIEHVSILDLLFNCGKDAINYLRYTKK